jgi:Tol biopolymer transport system component
MSGRFIAVLVLGGGLRLLAGGSGGFLTAPQGETDQGSVARASADVSANGRFIAFESNARLDPRDTNERRDVYVLDLDTRRVTLESRLPPDTIDTAHPRLSADGRWLVFEATLPPAGGAPPRTQVFLGDRTAGTLRIVSVEPGGRPANGSSRDGDVSDDGRLVVFASNATDLTRAPDANGGLEDVYLFDARSQTVERISLDSAGAQPASGVSISPSLTGDGRAVAFASSAVLTTRAGAPTALASRNATKQIYVRDLSARVTTLVSAGPGPGGAAGDRSSWAPSISADGRLIAFASDATNLAGGRNRTADVFLRDLQASTVTLVSRGVDGDGGSGMSGAPAISADGRFVAFESDAPNLVCARRCAPEQEDINLLTDVFLFDREDLSVSRVTQDETGEWLEASRGPALDGTGRVLAFSSRHAIDSEDVLEDFDLFVRIEEPRRNSGPVFGPQAPVRQP